MIRLYHKWRAPLFFCMICFTLACGVSNGLQENETQEDDVDIVVDSDDPVTPSPNPDDPTDSNDPNDIDDPDHTDDTPITTILQRYYTDDPDAVCNDGTQSVYYFRPGFGTGKRKWVLNLKGGGRCSTVQECTVRMQTSPNLTSSKNTQAQITLNGIFSQNKETNPDFYNWNHVYLYYCSSDSWKGDREGSPLTNGIHFRGSHIVDAIQDHLNNNNPNNNLFDATDIIFAGMSAGSSGAGYNLDSIAYNYPQAKVRGLLDAAFPIQSDEYLKGPEGEEAIANEKIFFTMINATVDPNCVSELQSQGENPELCYLKKFQYQFIQTPFFAIMSQMDNNFLGNLGINASDIDQDYYNDNIEFFNKLRLLMYQSLEKLATGDNGYFSPFDTIHVHIINDKKWHVSIEDTPLWEAFSNWYFEKDGPTQLFESDDIWRE